MPIDYSDTDAGYRLIKLSGRLDIPGTGEIDLKFTALTASNKLHLIVDLTEVSFLASIGIRSIITNAKAQQQRGGKMVLVVIDNSSVSMTLDLTGVDSLVPMFTTLTDAEQALAQ